MKPQTTIIPIEGMSCAACAGKIERKLSCVPGVDWVSVNFANKKALVRGTATLESLCEAIELSGYKANLQQAKSPERDHAQLKTQKMSASLALALSAPVVFLSMAHIDSRWSQWLQLLFTLPVLFLGRNFFIRAFKSVKNRSATMDTLVALGTGTAFLFSVFQMLGHKNQLYFESASVVIALVLVGRTLEEIAKNRSQSALFDLMTVAPQTVIRISKTANLSSSTQIPLSELKKGDYFLVRPGEVVATDGLVVEGISSVEESKLTGESAPKEKGIGSIVFAGTCNQNGRLVVEATELGEQTRISKLVRMVEEAQGSKTEIQSLADKISGLFVPIVMCVSAVTFIVWWLSGQTIIQALLPSVAVLVIACPCALGLATPTAIITGIGRAAELGILIRDAKSLERSHQIDVLLLDKTGTLTEGNPKVVSSFYCPTGKSEFRYVAAIENQASHPLAKAISEHAKKFQTEDSDKFVIEEFKNVPGMGCSGKVEGKNVYVGSRQWVESQGVNTVVDWLPHAELEKIKQEGKSRVWASVDNHLTSVLVIHDELRTGAKAAVAELLKETKVKILSGDNTDAVLKVAKELGIDEWLAEVTPIQKAEEVKRLKEQGLKVAMVGDGVNDGPALALADVSFTFGSGTDLAKEVSSITIVNGDLSKVLQAFRLSHLVMRVVKQNLFAAFFYNAFSIPIAAFGLLSPMLAGMAMALSSVSVVLNSYRLKLMMRN